MTYSLPRYIALSPDVLFQKLNDGSVLLDLISEQYIGLDLVATHIWQLLMEDGDTEHVIAQMLELYDVDEKTLRDDMAMFLKQLQHQGLARLEPAPQ
jgi:hypothetical protein